MGLFKSKDEKRLEREIKVKQGLSNLRRRIEKLDMEKLKFIESAKKAKRLNDQQMYLTARAALKNTIASKRILERQLLHLEVALQIKNQAEANESFARAMSEATKAIAEVCQGLNMAQIQIEYEKAITQSESLKEKMDTLVETASDRVQETGANVDKEIVNDAEIDKMLEDELAKSEAEEAEEMNQKILESVKDLQNLKDKQKG